MPNALMFLREIQLPDFYRKAMCAGMGYESFYPTDASSVNAAKFCHDCPVENECLEWALENREDFGIWGGLTARQRVTLRRKREKNTV